MVAHLDAGRSRTLLCVCRKQTIREELHGWHVRKGLDHGNEQSPRSITEARDESNSWSRTFMRSIRQLSNFQSHGQMLRCAVQALELSAGVTGNVGNTEDFLVRLVKPSRVLVVTPAPVGI